MTLINKQKTVEENTSQLNHNQQESYFEEEVPTLIIHSSSPPSIPSVTFDSNSSKTVSSQQQPQQPQLSLNLQINQNYYNSNSFDSPVSIISQSDEEIDEEDLEFASFKSVSNQYFQVSSPSIQSEEFKLSKPLETMMNANNNNNNYQQPTSQDYKSPSTVVEYGMHQEPTVPYNDNLIQETIYDHQHNPYGNTQEFQPVEYINPNHYGQPVMIPPQQQIIYDLPRETPEMMHQPTLIHAPADVDIEAHHIKVDQVDNKPRNILEWMKENRLLTIFIVIAAILFFYAAAMVIVNSVVHLIPCVLVTILPILLVKKRLIMCAFVLGALFIDTIISAVLLYHIMEEDGEWNTTKIALVFVLYVQEIINQVLGCIIVFRIYQKRVKNASENTQ